MASTAVFKIASIGSNPIVLDRLSNINGNVLDCKSEKDGSIPFLT